MKLIIFKSEKFHFEFTLNNEIIYEWEISFWT